jgi:hypothetical protein
MNKMNEKYRLILSWVLLALMIPSFFWWDDDFAILLAIACLIIRNKDILNSDKKNKKSIFFAAYFLTIAGAYWGLILWTPFGSFDSSLQFKALVFIMFMPLVPRFIIHEYNKYLNSTTF